MQGSNTSDVSGQVVRWSHENGVAKLEASAYIEMLEREVEILRQELDDSNEVRLHPVHSTVPLCACDQIALMDPMSGGFSAEPRHRPVTAGIHS